MSKAIILSAVGGGLYSANLEFNTEVVEFNIQRFLLRQQDIENIDLPQAESDLAIAENDLADAAGRLNEVINQLAGKPSAALFAALNAVDSALTSAAGFLTNTQTALASAAAFIAIAASSLPPSPDPPSVAAIAFAGSTIGIASGSVNSEQSEVTTAQSQVGNIISELSLSDPDLDQAQTDVAALLSQLDTVLSAHVQASSDINFAQGQTQAARNILPGDVSYDPSRAALDNALLSFAVATADHTAANAQYVIAQSQIGQAQALLTPGRDGSKKAVKDALKALNEAQKTRTLAQFAVDSLSLEFQELERKIRELDAIAKSQTGQLWCADLTEDIPSGAIVGTMEVPGELGLPASGIGAAVIRPAFDHTHLWNFQRDGWLTPCQAQTPAATFYNLAIMPGWQVFKPTFRFARVLAINQNGTLKIALILPNISSQQDIDVTPIDLPSSGEPQAVNYDSVPVHYMDCGAKAFAVGDQVTVEYQQQQATKPLVIGFRDHPRSCTGQFITPVGSITPHAGIYTFGPNTIAQYGAMEWRGEAGAFSWDGSECRYFNHPKVSDLTVNIYRAGGIFIHAPGLVCGVGVTKAGTMTCVIIDAHHVIAGKDMATKYAFYQAPAGTENWTRVGEYELENISESFTGQTRLMVAERPSHWRFDSSGKHAVVNGLGWLTGNGFYPAGMPMEIIADCTVTPVTFSTVPSTPDLVDGFETTAFYTHVWSDYRDDTLVWADFFIDGSDGDLFGVGTDRMYLAIPADGYVTQFYLAHSTDVGNSDWNFLEYQSIDLRLTPSLFVQLHFIGEWHGSAPSVFVTTTLEHIKPDASIESLGSDSRFPEGSPVGKDLVADTLSVYTRFIYSGLYNGLASLAGFTGMLGASVDSGVLLEDQIDPILHGGTQATLITGEVLFSCGFFAKNFLRRPEGDYQALTKAPYHFHIGVK